LQLAIGVSLLMLCIFIDGTHLANDGGAKAVPVYATLGNFDSTVARYLIDICTLRYICLTDICRIRGSRVLLGFLPIFGKGYTEAQTKTLWFRERSAQVMQQALSLVLAIQISVRHLPDILTFSKQMFAPLLEPGEARDGTLLLRDTAGLFRRFALRLGMFMSDIPEINRQLGICQIPSGYLWLL
jgi:hypothetical protein